MEHEEKVTEVLTTINRTAKEMDIPEEKFVQFLLSCGLVYRMRGQLMPYARYLKKGWFQMKEVKWNGIKSYHPYFTEKGRTVLGLLRMQA